ncbi:p21-activated protein kinase-interacting protein 1-like [Halyomorpha halys]|uniref:p21-activated protein kinase-interacting protein 1-like n=1 Tax=Halyomorpha halys TaxID=286706 RepID=UPI0006D52051|nr:p21-activated protein kinase-interacting protein 1-like [Halyomorpha halys]
MEPIVKEGVLFEILGGTYEEFTVGYECVNTDGELKLVQTVATHSHHASLRSIGVYNGPIHDILATGGADDTVHLYDLRCRKECGILSNHSGTVTCVRFTPDGSHLISASEDGSIAIFKVGSWFMEKVWPKAHKGMGVLHLSIHPSGKMAFSIGADKTLRTWNLVKGRPAYTVNLSGKVNRPEIVEWSLCGEYYGIVNDNSLDIYAIETAKVIHSLKVGSRISCVTFIQEGKVCIGDWSGCITCYSFKSNEKLWELKEGTIRLKALSSFENYLISVDGQGLISVYDLSSKKPKKKTSYPTSCRITCITVSKLMSEEDRPKKKQKIIDYSNLIKVENKERKIRFEDEAPREESISDVVCFPKSQKWIVKSINP